MAQISAPAATRPARLKPAATTEDCTSSDCHGDLLGRKVMHGPVAAKKCLDCHEYLDPAAHLFKPAAATDQGCIRCHEMKHKPVLHEPLKTGRCTDCHDAHGSEHAKILRADAASGCEQCHKQQSDPANVTAHRELVSTAGACGACHESHSSENARLLKQPATALCISCHKELRPVPGEALSTHASARDNCMACHDPHGSKHKYALKQTAPDLCLSCHKNVKDSMASAVVAHGGTMSKDQSCLACHVSHFSKLSKLQKEPQPQQCLNCHDRTLLSDSGRTIANMAALLKENPDHHGPIRLGACTACHQPHGSDNPKLLSAAYPPEFYAAFKEEQYKLCFSCHTPQMVLDSQPTAPTGFKDGQRNLHWLHVNQEKGRTCRACHEVHASRQPFHIRESVPYGPSGWAITLKYRKTATGGTCESGCHKEQSYDYGTRPRTLSVVALTPRGQALLSPVSAESAPTTAPVTASGAGDYAVPPPPFTPGAFPCSACHDPTVAVNTQRRELGKPHEEIKLQHDEQHRWCLDCHNAQNRDVLRSASGEPIPFAESYRLCGQCHGSQYRDWKVGVHGKRSGEWNGRKEYLLCVHCHNPHSPKFKQIAPLPPPNRPKSH